MEVAKHLILQSEEDWSVFFEVEARHIRKVVLCVLLEEWRAVLGNIAEDHRITQSTIFACLQASSSQLSLESPSDLGIEV